MDNQLLYTGTSSRGITTEIEIPVPWGVVAGKTYGEPCNPPVLCLHGWLDNCNTFDTLIPMLPQDRFYAFIDLPGYGRSSGIPIGSIYVACDSVAVIHKIADYFSWGYFSIITHSMSSHFATLFAGTFPERVDKLLLLDSTGAFLGVEMSISLRLRLCIEKHAKFQKEVDIAPKTYSYEEIKKRLLQANTSLDGPSADILLERGLVWLENGTCKLVRDIRHTFWEPFAQATPEIFHFMSKVRAETLHVIAKRGIMTTFSDYRKEVTNKIFENGFKSSEFYRCVTVDGMHFVHLCQPDKVIEHITTMLNRPPRSGLLQKQPSTFPRL